jgi:hypothetical protein
MATSKSDDDPGVAAALAALAAWDRALQKADDRRDDFAKAVAAAIKGGTKPAELVRKTGKSAETIRQMARAHGVERLREPTVTSIRKLREQQSDS